jgi:hypothetical protein
MSQGRVGGKEGGAVTDTTGTTVGAAGRGLARGVVHATTATSRAEAP